MRFLTSAVMAMGFPHSRVVSPGHLLVASKPALEPKPETGERARGAAGGLGGGGGGKPH